MKKNAALKAILLAGMFLLFPAAARAQTALPAVRAVLFYSPTCGHCELVIAETLIPMTKRYGDQLQILGVDVSQPQGSELFSAALQKFGLERGGVPFLVIDNIYLVGSQEIPERFPGMVETYLAQGGLDWPNLPGLEGALPAGTSQTSPPEPLTPDSTHLDKASWRERFARDPLGNSLSVVILTGMLGAAVWAVVLFRKPDGGASLKDNWSWAILALSIAGALVAGYLAYVETAQVEAVCGPVGDCNTVQQSEYARLFGVLPIGMLGLIGYAGIVIAWAVGRFADGQPGKLAALALFGMTAAGALFSIYLTFLEPFVIGATCAWCLTSAVLMTVLMLLSVKPAKAALSRPSHVGKSRALPKPSLRGH